LRDAVADAANVGAGLWFSYVFVLLYLSIAVGAITHLDLLLLNSVKLPFLNVELPLIGFFILGPFLLLIVHAYVLLHMSGLPAKSVTSAPNSNGRLQERRTRSACCASCRATSLCNSWPGRTK
jgi:hypothetical protein